ncbi:hypothetical protein RB600_006740 [Gaeumannomyces tritici]
MDCSLPVEASDGSFFHWSDRRSMDSDDDPTMMLDQAPRWMDSAFSMCPSLHPSARPSHLDRAGHLSPISTSMDMIMTADGACDTSCPPSATAPAMIHSASSSSSCDGDAWSNRFGDSDDHSAGESAHDGDANWEQGSDDVLTLPKTEPMDDDDYVCMDDLKEAPLPPIPSSELVTAGIPKVKRPRGRPRKHPLPANCAANKVTKGRSKTGCITCRKRKKKCDEAKPRCMNCEKNAVVCEGYPEKQIWKSGKERAEEARLQTSIPTVTMQPIFEGLETLEDRIFWKHYNDHLSTVLTVEGEHRNAFKEMLIPIATRDKGLMHSILSVSSTHLDLDTPYGSSLLKKHPKTTAAALAERSSHHRAQAINALQNRDPRSSDLSLSATYGQMLCLILESVAEGRSDGLHQLHLKGYQRLVRESPPQDPALRAFITEFFQYHIFADELLSQQEDAVAYELYEELVLSPPAECQEAPRLLGVVDGLFGHLGEITSIRNRIRGHLEAHIDPLVDYPSLFKAEAINHAISDWEPSWPRGDSRERVAPLYKQMMWVYLYRTVYPPSISPASPAPSASSVATASTVSEVSLPPRSMHYRVSNAAPVGGSTSLVNTPPRSPDGSCSPSPELLSNNPASMRTQGQDVPTPHSPRHNSITHQNVSAHCPLSSAASSFSYSSCDSSSPHTKRSGSTSSSSDVVHQQGQHPYQQQAVLDQHHCKASSPPPVRVPCQEDRRVTLAVEQSLDIIDSITPTDPAQTLLLIPCLVVGTACFAPQQQDRIRAAVHTVRGYTGLRNADRVLELLEEVWRLMAEGDWLAVWDWQGVASRKGLNFLCA